LERSKFPINLQARKAFIKLCPEPHTPARASVQADEPVLRTLHGHLHRIKNNSYKSFITKNLKPI
jgi:hypothetical protein